MSNITDDFIDALHRLETSSDVDAIRKLFSANATLSNPLVIHSAEDGGSAGSFWKAYRGAFEEIASEFITVAEGDGCAMLEWRSEGTVQGNSISYSGVSVIEFGADQITSFRAYFDPRELVAKVEGAVSEDLTPSDVQASSET